MKKDDKRPARPVQTTETIQPAVEVAEPIPNAPASTTHVHGTQLSSFELDVTSGLRRGTYTDWKGAFAQWMMGCGPKPAMVRTAAYIYRVLADNPKRKAVDAGKHFDSIGAVLDLSLIGFDFDRNPFAKIGLTELAIHFNLWDNIDTLLFNEQEKKVMDALLVLLFEQDRVFTIPTPLSMKEWLPLTVKLVGENIACMGAHRDNVYDYVMFCAGTYAYTVISHNYNIASELYKKYLIDKVRFVTRTSIDVDDNADSSQVRECGILHDVKPRKELLAGHTDEPRVAVLPQEEAVEPDNGRTVGTILDTPESGTLKITGIGTPELACEVIPDETAEVVSPDTVYGETARALRDGMSLTLPRSDVTVQIHKHNPEDPVPGTMVEVVQEQNPIVQVKELESITLDPEGRRKRSGNDPELVREMQARPEGASDSFPRSVTLTLPPDFEPIKEGIERLIAELQQKANPNTPFAPVVRKKRGWLTGKFCMLHMGHINFIHQAATLCDELVVVLSHSDHRFKDSRLSYRNKMLWLRTTFKNEPHITVVGIDETDVPEYPNGWQAWSDLVKAKIGTDFDYIFTSEPGDQSGYNTYFPGQEVRVVDADRKSVDISATRIRGDMVKHWGMMPTVVRKDFVMRICIVGTESVGKSTLTKMLAKRHQTSWVEEYGRTYCEQDLCMDEDLLCYEDYGTIAARRYDMEQEAALSANRVLFVDTAAMSTNYFCLLYEGREHPMVSAYQERERYDAYIYLTDDVAFVEDGLRKNRNRDNTRFLFEKMLYANAKRHGSEIFKVSGNYNERLNKAIAIVDELLARPLTLV